MPNRRYALLEMPVNKAKEVIFRLVANAASGNINNPLDYAYWTGYLEGAAWLYGVLKNNLIGDENDGEK